MDKCLYCSFYSVPRRSIQGSVMEAVVQETLQQARFFTDALQLTGPPQTVFMGGGTPSALPRQLLNRLLTGLELTASEEWTVEANPESIDEAFLQICAQAGVTRISAGVQSTDDGRLRTLRRTGTRSDILRAAQLLARQWRSDVNLDFIAGIPGQRPAEITQDLSLLDGVPAAHVSLYSLTYEPGTPLARMVEKGEIRANSLELDEELWFSGVEELRRRGYLHYEVSNFCRPGKECRHNLRYWHLEPYLGVGPGAVSTLPAGPIAAALQRPELAQHGNVLRMANPCDLRAFLVGRQGLWGASFEPVQPTEFLMETLMMGLRLAEGISARGFAARFGSSFEGIFPGLWESWVKRGAAHPAADRLALSDSGRMVLDGLLAEIRQDPEERRLQVSWP